MRAIARPAELMTGSRTGARAARVGSRKTAAPPPGLWQPVEDCTCTLLLPSVLGSFHTGLNADAFTFRMPLLLSVQLVEDCTPTGGLQAWGSTHRGQYRWGAGCSFPPFPPDVTLLTYLCDRALAP